jgi:hypothetical protein
MSAPIVFPLCLIGGSGRSGTTVLQQVFTTHPRVAGLSSEARFLTDPGGVVDFFNTMTAGWSPYGFDADVRRLETLLRTLGHDRKLARLIGRWLGQRSVRQPGAPSHPAGLRRRLARSALARLRPPYWEVGLSASCPSYLALVDELMDRLIEFRFAGRWMGTPLRQKSQILYGPAEVGDALRMFSRRFVRCVCEGQGATHLVEDSPQNLLAFGGIWRLLPESRLLHVHRDPRDVVASYLRQRWSPSEPEKAARFYVGIMRRWDVVRAELPEGTFKEIALETLVREPEPVLRQICEFWNLPWDEALLEFDLTHSNSGRWRTDIPRGAIRQVSAILGEYVERYGQL